MEDFEKQHMRQVRGHFRKKGQYRDLPKCSRCQVNPIYHYPAIFPDQGYLTLDLCATCRKKALKEEGASGDE